MCNRDQPQCSKVGLCMETPRRSSMPTYHQGMLLTGVFLCGGLSSSRAWWKPLVWRRWLFDQGALGNPQRRPTRCLTNLELGLQGLRDSRTSWPQPVRREDPSVWPQGFRETLCSAIKSWNKAMETDATTKAMGAKERSEWKEHLNNNHFPYRRDCSVCLQASGTGRQQERWSTGMPSC